MSFLPLLLLAADLDPLVAAHRLRTRAEMPCEAPTSVGEVVVCGRREADRYRVPFVAADPRDSVHAERAALLEPPMQGCGRVGQFFTDCGFVGVTVSTSGGSVAFKTRKLAP